MKTYKIIPILILSIAALFVQSCEQEPITKPGSGGSGNSPGQVMFWLQSDLGCGSITVNVSGYGSKIISSYYSAGVSSCGADGCATFSLPDGNYSYTASCSGGTTWSGTVNSSRGYCNKIKLIASGGSSGGGGGGSGGGSGGGGSSSTQMMFYTSSDLGEGNITVTLSGYSSKYITKYFSSGTPDCGVSGAATYTVPSGTYSYTAKGQAGGTWSGSVNVVNGQCNKLRLIANNSGGGGGGGNTPTQLMFYTSTDLGQGNITVTLSGYSSKYITSYYPSGAPDCGASGNATYTIPAGTYSYTAKGQAGGTWSGSVNVSNGKCNRLRLTL